MDPVYIIDGYSIIYRSYFAFLKNPLLSPEGRNSSAVFGFFSFLFKLKDKMKPNRLAIAMDSPTPTFRHKLYKEYKANRQKTPEDLHAQIPVIMEILAALGIPALRVDGYEADDIIATIAEMCRRDEAPCYILSGDKDLLQLVGGGVKILWPVKGSQEFMEWDEREVFENRGISPLQMVDYLSMAGDSSDNVPGIPGVGDKTAVKLLNQFQSLDGIYQNINQISSETQKNKLLDGRESAHLSRKLVELKRDVPLEGGIKLIDPGEPDLRKALSLLHKEGIKTFDSRLGKTDGSDLKQARPGMYRCITNIRELDIWIDKARSKGIFAFDSETDSLDALSAKPIGFSLATAAGEACYIPIRANVLKPGEKCLDETLIREKLSSLLKDNKLKVIGQNLKYDYKVLKRWGVEIENIYFDTMIAAWLLDTTRNSYSLDRLAADYLAYNTIHYTDLAGKNGSLMDVELSAVTDYAAEDADIALQLYRVMSVKLKELNLTGLFHQVEMPNVRILGDMELKGINIDAELMADFSKELAQELKTIKQKIYDACGREFNINSTKQLQQVLFEERKLKPGKKTKTGFSTDAQVLAELAEEDEVCASILYHRTLTKLKSTYVDSLPRMIHPETGRLHTHYIQTGTATGRLSSKDPNLQNIPVREEIGRRIRSAFTADKGYLFLSADYSQIELAVLAGLSGDPVLKEAFQSGKDIHAHTASLLFDVDETLVSPEMRRIGKTINFGVNYGMSAFRLARDLKMPRKDAESFIRIYFERYSGIDRFIKDTIRQAEEKGYVETIKGRRRALPRINSLNKTEKRAEERIAVNTPIQGSAADIVKMAMIEVSEGLSRKGYKTRLILQVHDELIFEAPEEEVKETGEFIRNIMEQIIDLGVPLRVNIEKGGSWGDIH
jgi:DNA polymerase-1